MKTQLNLICKCLAVGAVTVLTSAVLAKEAPSFEVKGDSLRYLQELRNRESKRLREINDSLAKKMDESTSVGLDKDVEVLKVQQHEHQLRQTFLDRLIFQVDTKFGGGDMRAFLQGALIDMAKVDAVTSAQTDAGLWKFLKYSADAIRRLPEQKENILAFLEGYMNKSVANPIPPQEYLAARNYTNGATSDSGSPLSREDAGTMADRRIQELKPAPSVPAANQTLQ